MMSAGGGLEGSALPPGEVVDDGAVPVDDAVGDDAPPGLPAAGGWVLLTREGVQVPVIFTSAPSIVADRTRNAQSNA